MKKLAMAVVCGFLLHPVLGADAPANPYGAWKMGPPRDVGFFPVAVWCQNPKNAAAYREAGFNTYVALWNGPTEEQLATLKKEGIKVICEMNDVGRKHLDDPTIIGWMHGDEPDNAQSLGEGKGYGPPIEPRKIIDEYSALRTADPQRPVMLNLGQGVAWDTWYGRGPRSNHPEDYPEYIKGSDIVSFDIYPACHDNAQIAGKLWYVASGTERLVKWTGGKQIVWDCIECTHISNPKAKATPHQVRCEVWMSLIHGSQGLIYFVHEFSPKFKEAALLDDLEMLREVTSINRQIQRLAPVINTPSASGAVSVSCANTNVPVAVVCKCSREGTYVFAVGMREGATQASFHLANAPGLRKVEVIDEGRTLESKDGVFVDSFNPWDVHLYRLR